MDADAVLAQYQRAKAQAAGPRQRPVVGRRLDEASNAPVPSRASSDTDAAMRWMESKLDALTADVAAAPALENPLPSARRNGLRGRRESRSSGVGSSAIASQPPQPPQPPQPLAQLAELEAATREQTSRLRAERAHVAGLREQLRAAGVEAEATVPSTAAAPTAEGGPSSSSAAPVLSIRPPEAKGSGGRGAAAGGVSAASSAASAAVRIGGGGGGGGGVGGVGGLGGGVGGGTSASELEVAASRRLSALRRQAPLIQAELDAVRAERSALEGLARTHGLVAAAPAMRIGGGVGGGAGGGGGGSSGSSGRASPENEAGGGGGGGSPLHPRALLHQLHRIDAALRAMVAKGSAGGGGGGGGGYTSHAGRVHSLSSSGPPLVPLTVFSDGFMLFRGPFRPFPPPRTDAPRSAPSSAASAASASTAAFVREVMAGCVPSELDARYPSGFGFELHDCCALSHAEAQAEALSSHAARAGGGGEGRQAGGVGAVRGLADVPSGVQALLLPQSGDSLLRALPASVVSEGGDLVPIRSELAAALGRRDPTAAGAATRAAPTTSDAASLDALRAARLRRFEQR